MVNSVNSLPFLTLPVEIEISFEKFLEKIQGFSKQPNVVNLEWLVLDEMNKRVQSLTSRQLVQGIDMAESLLQPIFQYTMQDYPLLLCLILRPLTSSPDLQQIECRQLYLECIYKNFSFKNGIFQHMFLKIYLHEDGFLEELYASNGNNFGIPFLQGVYELLMYIGEKEGLDETNSNLKCIGRLISSMKLKNLNHEQDEALHHWYCSLLIAEEPEKCSIFDFLSIASFEQDLSLPILLEIGKRKDCLSQVIKEIVSGLRDDSLFLLKLKSLFGEMAWVECAFIEELNQCFKRGSERDFKTDLSAVSVEDELITVRELLDEEMKWFPVLFSKSLLNKEFFFDYFFRRIVHCLFHEELSLDEEIRKKVSTLISFLAPYTQSLSLTCRQFKTLFNCYLYLIAQGAENRLNALHQELGIFLCVTPSFKEGLYAVFRSHIEQDSSSSSFLSALECVAVLQLDYDCSLKKYEVVVSNLLSLLIHFEYSEESLNLLENFEVEERISISEDLEKEFIRSVRAFHPFPFEKCMRIIDLLNKFILSSKSLSNAFMLEMSSKNFKNSTISPATLEIFLNSAFLSGSLINPKHPKMGVIFDGISKLPFADFCTFNAFITRKSIIFKLQSLLLFFRKIERYENLFSPYSQSIKPMIALQVLNVLGNIFILFPERRELVYLKNAQNHRIAHSLSSDFLHDPELLSWKSEKFELLKLMHYCYMMIKKDPLSKEIVDQFFDNILYQMCGDPYDCQPFLVKGNDDNFYVQLENERILNF